MIDMQTEKIDSNGPSGRQPEEQRFASVRHLLGEAFSVFPLLLFALVLRLAGLGRLPLTMDEIEPVVHAMKPLAFNLFYYSYFTLHLPLYYIFLHLWVTAFGADPVSVRLPSVFFGMISLIYTYLLARLLLPRKEAITGTLILCISANHLIYSQYSRPYMMAVALSTAALFHLFIYIRRGGFFHLFLSFLLWALALATHFISLTVLGTIAVYFVIWPEEIRVKRWPLFISGILLSMLLARSYTNMYTFLMTPDIAKADSILSLIRFGWPDRSSLSTDQTVRFLSKYFLGELSLTTLWPHEMWLHLLFTVLFVGVITSFLLRLSHGMFPDQETLTAWRIAFLAFFPFVSVALMCLLIGRKEFMVNDRYLSVALPYMSIFFGYSIYHFTSNRWRRVTVMILFSFIFLYSLISYFFYYQVEDFGLVARTIRDRAAPGDIVVVEPSNDFSHVFKIGYEGTIEVFRYYPPGIEIYGFDRRFDRPDKLQRYINNSKRIWFLRHNSTPVTDPGDEGLGYLRKNMREVEKINFFGMDLYLFERRTP